MDPTSTLELFIDGEWRAAAAVSLTGDRSRGIQTQSYLAYLTLRPTVNNIIDQLEALSG
jgi:hypothetical protein